MRFMPLILFVLVSGCHGAGQFYAIPTDADGCSNTLDLESMDDVSTALIRKIIWAENPNKARKAVMRYLRWKEKDAPHPSVFCITKKAIMSNTHLGAKAVEVWRSYSDLAPVVAQDCTTGSYAVAVQEMRGRRLMAVVIGDIPAARKCDENLAIIQRFRKTVLDLDLCRVSNRPNPYKSSKSRGRSNR